MACIFCASRTHNYRSCPLAYSGKSTNIATFKQEYVGQAPNVFLGRTGYPNIRVGILGTEQYDHHDDPIFWSANETPSSDIVRLRSAMVNAYFTAPVKGGKGKFTEMTQEVSVSRRPVDVEIEMARKPVARMTFNKDAQPHGPNVELRSAQVTQNIPIDTRVQKAIDATDMNASIAVNTLLQKGVDGYFLTKALSMGNFGIPTERKLVPTRWSITAVDDIAGKEHLKKIREFQQSDCLAYFGGHLGNYYLILIFDGAWEYELFEQYLPTTRQREAACWTDYEPHTGRTTYATETAGGYYAARIGITEHLIKQRRQGAVLAIRIITDEYEVPLGVWVVREAVRKTMETQATIFADKTLLLTYAKELLKRKFNFDIATVLHRSQLFQSQFSQRKLNEY